MMNHFFQNMRYPFYGFPKEDSKEKPDVRQMLKYLKNALKKENISKAARDLRKELKNVLKAEDISKVAEALRLLKDLEDALRKEEITNISHILLLIKDLIDELSSRQQHALHLPEMDIYSLGIVIYILINGRELDWMKHQDKIQDCIQNAAEKGGGVNYESEISKSIRRHYKNYCEEEEKWAKKPEPSKEKFYDYLSWRMLRRDFKQRIKTEEFYLLVSDKAREMGVS